MYNFAMSTIREMIDEAAKHGSVFERKWFREEVTRIARLAATEALSYSAQQRNEMTSTEIVAAVLGDDNE